MVAADFGNLSSTEAHKKLEGHLLKCSYISGHSATQDDVLVVSNLKGLSLPSSSFPNISRWFRHIMYFSEAEQNMWAKGQGVAGCAAPTVSKAAASAASKKVDEEDDDFDPFASDTEEDKAAQEAMAAKRKEAAAGAKPKKVVINKSTLVIDVKPVNLQTSLDEVEKLIREIDIEGVEWSKASKKLPIAFGLMKLQIGCTIIDDLVNTDNIVDQIECVGLNEADSLKKIAIRDGANEDEEDEDDECDGDGEEEEELGLVQSAEIVSFNKL